LFLPSRFDAHGDDDIPWLTRKLGAILEIDPEFVFEIYEKTFANVISDSSETSLGHSRILPLRSNRRQDFQMSYWNLKEFFPNFLRANPTLATKAYVKAVHGYVLRDHPPTGRRAKQTVRVAGRTCVLQEDWSYIWASNPNDQHGDNAVKIAQQFSKWLREATPEATLAAAETIISENEMALVWARLFMVAAERTNILGPVLWPIATNYAFLWASDTRKDGIDFIAATYPRLTASERATFEAAVLAFDFSDSDEPEKARGYVLKRLFATIGADRLLTEEGRALATVSDETRRHDYENDRPASFEVSSYATDDFWWLREQKVDTAAPENADILALAKSFKEDLQEQNKTKAFPTLEKSVAKLSAFLRDIDARPDSHPLVKSYATGAVADGLEAIVSMFEKELANFPPLADVLISMTTRLAGHPAPEVTPDTEESFEKSPSWGSPAPRISAAHAAMVLARVGTTAAGVLRLTIERLLTDPHPAVRMAIATRINALWLS
jgi:hypothetical protein